MSMSLLATIQNAINIGAGLGASVIGQSCAQYRCTVFDSPITATYQVGTLFAAFDTRPTLTFIESSKPLLDVFYGYFNLTNVQSGDYLVGPQGTFFVSNIEPLKQPVCIQCPHTVSLSSAGSLRKGTNPMREFNGLQDAMLAPLIPASILPDRPRGMPLTGLPDDILARSTFKGLISPAFGNGASGAISAGDTMTDEGGLSYQVEEALWHPSAWQLRLELLG
jgi:hypothetical protein